MRKTFAAVIAAIGAVAMLVSWWPAEACVGKTIFVGRLPGKEQEVLAEIFTWMVSERTGTTIVTKNYPDSKAMHAALQTADVDLYLEDPGVALREILGRPAGEAAADVREIVRREYEQRFNLVWLEPWGMTGHAGMTPPTLVAPVIRKDTLKKFPALSRLVNKLSGAINDATLAKLVQDAAQRPARDVAKQFLKDKRLI
ncbi:MAG TPA: glycine betaine ABC transporter substrate-binding protein [bacterium]